MLYWMFGIHFHYLYHLYSDNGDDGDIQRLRLPHDRDRDVDNQSIKNDLC